MTTNKELADADLCAIKRGSELKVGDVIEVWWKPGRDTVLSLEPYTGPLVHIFPDGAQIASLAMLVCGMTIDNNDIFKVFGAPRPTALLPPLPGDEA